MRYCNAGHNQAILLHRDGSIELLEATGIPIGLLPGAEYSGKDTMISEGDLLVLYTDGIVEATDRAELMFGEERFKTCIATKAHSSANDVLNSIFAELTDFTGQNSHQDDVSVSVLKFI